MAPADAVPVQALVRWDPAGAAERELADRTAVGFPPAVRLADLSGAAADLADLLATAQLPPSAAVLGPVPFGDAERALVRVPRADGPALSAALKTAQAIRSARRDGGVVRVRLDPVDVV